MYATIDRKSFADGRVEKKSGSGKRPVSAKEKAARAAARKAMRTGATMSEDQRRRAEQDRRTLYIRFKVCGARCHPGIRFRIWDGLSGANF